MIKKKIFIVVVICAIAVGGYLAIGKFLSSRKTVSVSVLDLMDEKNSDTGNIPNEENLSSQQTQQKEEAVQQPVEAGDNKKNVDSNQSSEISNQVVDSSKKEDSVISHQSAAINTEPVEKKADSTSDDSVKNTSGKVVNKLVSWGFQKSSARTIKAIVVHTSYNNLGGDVFDFDKVIQEWKDAGVSPHYAIDRDGTIYQLVADQNIAWHAGTSKLPDGTTDVNGASIGVEIINSQDAKFTDVQYASLNSLIATLKKKYPIKYVLGHDEIAPGRKTDPWGIVWSKVSR